MEIEPESKAFLISLFTDLRKDLADREGEEGQRSPEPKKVVRELAIFDALLTGLERGEAPDDEAVREYVAGLARAADVENEYERVALEHRALTELDDTLTQT